MTYLKLAVILACVAGTMVVPVAGALAGSVDALLGAVCLGLFWVALFRAAMAGFRLEGRR